MDDAIPLAEMMEWLKQHHPAAFDDILHAVLVVVDEDELDEALEAAGWVVGDINLLVSRAWLTEQLNEDGVEDIKTELEEAIYAYLEEAGQTDACCNVAVIDDRCTCCGCCEECTCDIPDEDEAEIPWEIVIDVDYKEEIGEELAASLTTHIEEHIIIPIFEKYGFVVDVEDAPE